MREIEEEGKLVNFKKCFWEVQFLSPYLGLFVISLLKKNIKQSYNCKVVKRCGEEFIGEAQEED